MNTKTAFSNEVEELLESNFLLYKLKNALKAGDDKSVKSELAKLAELAELFIEETVESDNGRVVFNETTSSKAIELYKHFDDAKSDPNFDQNEY